MDECVIMNRPYGCPASDEGCIRDDMGYRCFRSQEDCAVCKERDECPTLRYAPCQMSFRMGSNEPRIQRKLKAFEMGTRATGGE